MEQVQALLINVWIEQWGGPRGSSIVLATKYHLEHIQNIDDFIWRICVSYRKLNSITKPFEFPIPHLDDSIRTVGYGSNKIWIVSLEARQRYHQMSACHVHKKSWLCLHHRTKIIRYSSCNLGPLTPTYSIQL